VAYSGRVAAWKPAYLIHGDAHGRIAERRGKLRTLAEAESGVEAVEVFEGDTVTPEAVAGALNAMTFALGRRFVIVDGVERWKDADVEAHLSATLSHMPPETTAAFFAREDGRAKAPAKLVALVKKIGSVDAEATLKAKDLPGWAIVEAQRLGVTLERPAARALVTSVGERQQRLLRELEKLAIEHGPGATLGLDEVEAAAHSAERQVWGLVDALVARDGTAATRAFLELRAQGEAIPRLVPLMARRVRDVLAIAARLEAGESPAQVKETIKGSPWMADRRIKEARATDADALRRALEALAGLEVATRGGSELDDDTAALRAIATITA
jgi:DNA polymerase III subunit delta